MSNKTRGVTRAALIKITTAAVLTALSAVFALTFRFPLFTAFYEMEFSDFPLLVCTFLLGPVYGLSSLFAVCLIQTLTVSASSGIIGFIMHFAASGAMLLTVYFARKKISGTKGIVISSVLGVAVMVAVMIPMNIWLTSVFMKLPASEFISGYLGVCAAFNFIKSASNILLFSLTFKTLKNQFNKLIRE